MQSPDASPSPQEVEAYILGLNAAWQPPVSSGVSSVSSRECPYPKGPLNDAWWSGFGDGTEDLIYAQRLDYK